MGGRADGSVVLKAGGGGPSRQRSRAKGSGLCTGPVGSPLAPTTLTPHSSHVQGQTYQPGFLPIVPPEARHRHVAATHAPSPAYDMYGYGLLAAQLINCLASPAGDDEWEVLRSDPYWLSGFIARAMSAAQVHFPADTASIVRDCLASHDMRPAARAVVARLEALRAALSP